MSIFAGLGGLFGSGSASAAAPSAAVDIRIAECPIESESTAVVSTSGMTKEAKQEKINKVRECFQKLKNTVSYDALNEKKPAVEALISSLESRLVTGTYAQGDDAKIRRDMRTLERAINDSATISKHHKAILRQYLFLAVKYAQQLACIERKIRVRGMPLDAAKMECLGEDIADETNSAVAAAVAPARAPIPGVRLGGRRRTRKGTRKETRKGTRKGSRRH